MNVFFHRSSYKFPIEDAYDKDDLTAVIESAHDSDTIQLRIKSIYPVIQKQTYYWSEIKLDGKRLY